MIPVKRRIGVTVLVTATAVMAAALLYCVVPHRGAGFAADGSPVSGGNVGTSSAISGDAEHRRGTGTGLAVFVGDLVMIPESGAAVVFLVTDDRERCLPITIGQFEALAITRFMQSVTPPRPMTHELLLDTVSRLGGQIVSITVDSFDQGTFKAFIRVGLEDGSETLIDARPSDSIALAIKAGAAMYVAPAVMDQAGRMLEEPDDGTQADPGPDAPGPVPFPRKPDAETVL
ncbi:MAG: bifunctional nuclease family protein [Syntrophales bacterium]|jgi:bifunctional DNase/RNase|nr:bifunctional nuclease family protein [Syntrophales bacterium]MCK9527709.1 bifunctional nuclease family protein [Syntrophales bacterium]MDX9921636.1 bifunctional nuclease family protein [Syntrophales bacterium]